MTPAEYAISAFTIFNGARALAYIPQLICIYRDPDGARAVSLLTWGLFTAANLATIAYALVVAADPVLAFVFALNAAGSLTIVVLVMAKRRKLANLLNDDTCRAAPKAARAFIKLACPFRDRWKSCLKVDQRSHILLGTSST